jgi:pimeloyl-ACP methyl ester carboxylesterase
MQPQRVKLRDHFVPLEFLRDFGVRTRTRLESRWTPVDGLRIHSRSSAWQGNDTPFLLIHGLVISSLYFVPLAECLAATAEVHALDLPGYGRSEKPRHPLRVPALADAVARWIGTDERGRWHVVANSFGCQVAAELAARYPETVATLTLIGPTVDPAAHSLFWQGARLLRDMPREPLRLWLNHVVDYCRAGPRFAPALMRAMMENRIEQNLPRIAAPTLILRGERDTIVPERWAREAAALVPRGRLGVVPRGSHCIHYAAPQAVAEAVLAFKDNEARSHAYVPGER